MKEICKLSFDGAPSECDKKSEKKKEVEKISFSAGDPLSEADLQRKDDVKEQIIKATKKCIDEKRCDALDLIALRWQKCEVCDKHLPYLRRDVIEPLVNAGVPVSYKELDAKGNGKELFVRSGCQGTPCILVKDRATNTYTKAYDGSQRDIAAMSSILGFKNPFFYGDIAEDEYPKNMVIPNGDKILINNKRSMWL